MMNILTIIQSLSISLVCIVWKLMGILSIYVFIKYIKVFNYAMKNIKDDIGVETEEDESE